MSTPPHTPPTSTLQGDTVGELIASGAIPALRAVTKRISLDDAATEGFEALLDPAGTQLKILIDLSR